MSQIFVTSRKKFILMLNKLVHKETLMTWWKLLYTMYYVRIFLIAASDN